MGKIGLDTGLLKVSAVSVMQNLSMKIKSFMQQIAWS